MSTQSTITANLAVTREKRSHLSFPLLENIMWHADFLERKYDICTVAIVEIFKLDVSLIIIESPTKSQLISECIYGVGVKRLLRKRPLRKKFRGKSPQQIKTPHMNFM